MYIIYYSKGYESYFFLNTLKTSPPKLGKRIYLNLDTGELFTKDSSFRRRGYERRDVEIVPVTEMQLSIVPASYIKAAIRNLPIHLHDEFKRDKYAFYNSGQPTEKTPTQGDTPMKKFNMKNIMGNMMKDMTGKVVLDVMTGKLAINANNSLYSLEGKQVVENPISDMCVEVPAYAVITPVKDVEVGDIVLNSLSPFFVLSKKGEEVSGIDYKGRHVTCTPTKNLMFSMEGVLVVKNLFGGMSNGEGMMPGMNPMMLMMMGDGDNNMKDMMMMSMMMGGNNPFNFGK